MGQEHLLVMFLTDGAGFYTKLILYVTDVSQSLPAQHSYGLFHENNHKTEYSSGFYFEEVNISHDHTDLRTLPAAHTYICSFFGCVTSTAQRTGAVVTEQIQSATAPLSVKCFELVSPYLKSYFFIFGKNVLFLAQELWSNTSESSYLSRES